MSVHVVLVEPEIPQNTGNISRTCACTGSPLHLIRPLGFSIDDRSVRRAGLDYWSELELHVHDSLSAFLDSAADWPMFLASTKSGRCYTQVSYPNNCYLLFGKETKGLPESLLLAHWEQCIRIPMRDCARSLNLSNSVAVILYEALRQQEFAGLLSIRSYFPSES